MSGRARMLNLKITIMHYTIKTIEKQGYKAEMGYMDYFESYREMDDNLGTIYSAQRNYDPDGYGIEELEEIIDPKETGCYDFSKLDKDYIWLPVDIYEHSGVTINIWDKERFLHYYETQLCPCYFGIIAVSKERVRMEYRCEHITKSIREKVEKILCTEIKDLDIEYQGMVCEYVVTDPKGDTVEAVSYYYNEDECESDMMEALNNIVEREEVEEEEKQIAMICGTL